MQAEEGRLKIVTLAKALFYFLMIILVIASLGKFDRVFNDIPGNSQFIILKNKLFLFG